MSDELTAAIETATDAAMASDGWWKIPMIYGIESYREAVREAVREIVTDAVRAITPFTEAGQP